MSELHLQADLVDSTLRELLRAGVTFALVQERICAWQEKDPPDGSKAAGVSYCPADEEWICVQPLAVLRRLRELKAVFINILVARGTRLLNR